MSAKNFNRDRQTDIVVSGDLQAFIHALQLAKIGVVRLDSHPTLEGVARRFKNPKQARHAAHRHAAAVKPCASRVKHKANPVRKGI